MRNKKKNEKVAYHTLHFICSLTKALRPKEKMSVSDWADKYMVLPGGSNKAGKFRSDSVPYQKEIMNAITDSAVTEVTVMSSAQIGKTTRTHIFDLQSYISTGEWHSERLEEI